MLTRHLGQADYMATLAAMQAFTDSRGPDASDELWFLEHPPVFTLGLNADPAHVLQTGDIPVLQTDRGGQVTYHGPGQLVCYVLMDVRRARLGVRELVTRLETAVIDTLAGYGIDAHAQRKAPGVYVGDAKIASLGLRIRRGCSYHGLSLNVAMDLTPYDRIDPCGYAGLPVTQTADLDGPRSLTRVATDLEPRLRNRLQK